MRDWLGYVWMGSRVRVTIAWGRGWPYLMVCVLLVIRVVVGLFLPPVRVWVGKVFLGWVVCEWWSGLGLLYVMHIVMDWLGFVWKVRIRVTSV